MSDKPFLIVSDVHLGAVPASTEQRFRAFLRHAAAAASGLLINGDLFDFWFEYRSVIPARHFRVLAALADVVEAGVPVSFVGGNHDAWGGDFLREQVGIRLLQGPIRLELAGRPALVAHGDGVGAGDLGYRALKRFIRSPLTVRAFRTLHPDWGASLAERVSSTEEKAAGIDAAKTRADHIRTWALEQLREHPEIALVTAGHAHLPELLEYEPGRFYANSGDWIHHFSYLVLPTDGGAPELRRWEG